MGIRRIRIGKKGPGVLPPTPGPPPKKKKMQIKVGTILKSTGAAPVSQSVTGLDFAPRALILWGVATTALDTYTADAIEFMGLVDQNNDAGSVCAAGDHAVNPPTEARYHSTSAIVINDFAGAVVATATATLTADGFELTWTTNDANAYPIHYMAIGGKSVKKTKRVNWVLPSGTGSKQVTGVGFRPDLAIHIYAYNPSIDAADSGTYLGIGAMTRAGTSCSMGTGRHPAWGDTKKAQYTTKAAVMPPAQMTGQRFRLAPVSYDNDGFTVTNELTAPAASYITSLCLKGGTYQAGYAFMYESGTESYSSLTLAPAGLLFMGDCSNVIGIYFEGNSAWQMGATDGTSCACASTNSPTGVPTVRGMASTSTYPLHRVASGSIYSEALLVSMNDDGWTFNWVNPGGQNVYCFLAFGP